MAFISHKILPRRISLVKNSNIEYDPYKFLVVMHYINTRTIRITTRRIDAFTGWDEPVTIPITIDNKKIITKIPASQTNEYISFHKLCFDIEPAKSPAVLPKNIIQTFPHLNIGPLRMNTIKHLIDLHPEFTYYLFTDELCEKFIKEKFPEYWDFYDSLVSGSYRADLFRGLVLKYYGGYYFDCKMIVLEPIGDWPYIISGSYHCVGGYNGVMGTSANSDFINVYIKFVVELGTKPTMLLGPFALRNAVNTLKIKYNFVENHPPMVGLEEIFVINVETNRRFIKCRFGGCYSENDISSYSRYNNNDLQGIFYRKRLVDDIYIYGDGAKKPRELVKYYDMRTLILDSPKYVQLYDNKGKVICGGSGEIKIPRLYIYKILLRLLKPFSVVGYSKINFGKSHTILDLYGNINSNFYKFYGTDLDFSKRTRLIPGPLYISAITNDLFCKDYSLTYKVPYYILKDLANLKTLLKANNDMNRHNLLLIINQKDSSPLPDSSVLGHFCQIIIKVSISENNTEGVIKSLRHFNKSHRIVHIHGDNRFPVTTLDKYKIPQSLEITYAARHIIDDYVTANFENYPTIIDIPCNINAPDHTLDFYPFKPKKFVYKIKPKENQYLKDIFYLLISSFS
jgi:mannosyltransferase OCH1-like enzyme